MGPAPGNRELKPPQPTQERAWTPRTRASPGTLEVLAPVGPRPGSAPTRQPLSARQPPSGSGARSGRDHPTAAEDKPHRTRKTRTRALRRAALRDPAALPRKQQHGSRGGKRRPAPAAPRRGEPSSYGTREGSSGGESGATTSAGDSSALGPQNQGPGDPPTRAAHPKMPVSTRLFWVQGPTGKPRRFGAHLSALQAQTNPAVPQPG